MGRTFQKRMDTSKMGEKRETQAYKLEGDGSSEEMHNGTDEVQRTHADRDGLIDFHVHHQLHGQINQCNTETEGSGDMGNNSQQPGMVDTKWIPKEKNQVADFLSKHRIQIWNFGLKEDQVSRIFKRGRPSVDLFTSENFHVCEKFYEVKAGRRWKDAFSLARGPDKSFAFPPVPLLQLALNRIKEEKIKAIVVTPESTAT